MPDDRLIAHAQNPEGRTVEIPAAAWEHVTDVGHPELRNYLEDVVATIERPEYREDDPRPGRERYFRRCGPEVWIRVVTQFAGEVDRLVTAFPQSNDPTDA